MSRPTYPLGLHGAALLLLRLSLADALAWVSLGCNTVSSPVSIAAAVLACLLAGGFFARSAAGFFALAELVFTILAGTLSAHVPLIAEAFALALLGPGAWSIDGLRTRHRVARPGGGR